MKHIRIMMILCILALVFAFALQASADTLVLPEQVSAVEDEAFYLDTAIQTVVLPDGVTSIGAKAFADSGLTEINLPNTLTYIADDAFDGTNITTLTVNEHTYAYTWAVSHGYFGWEWEEQMDGTVAITGCTHFESTVSIPRQIAGKPVSAIEDAAFAGSVGMVDVTVPGTVTRIGEAAFAGIASLKTVTVQQGVR